MKRHGNFSGCEHSASKRNILGGEHSEDNVVAEAVFRILLADRGVPSPDIERIIKVDARDGVSNADLKDWLEEFDPDMFIDLLNFSFNESYVSLLLGP